MPTQKNIAEIAVARPDVVPATDHGGCFVSDEAKPSGFAWPWCERIDPKRPKVENRGVFADKHTKEALPASARTKFFSELHDARFSALLDRPDAVDLTEHPEPISKARNCIVPRQIEAPARLRGVPGQKVRRRA